ncbi:MAG: DUF805 domain-containing protein [SAR202 cluster bacterium]|nr:DUF805 domain-containing protein [SAR202 cluster bacterium]
MTCGKCGYYNIEPDNFCGACGAPMEGNYGSGPIESPSIEPVDAVKRAFLNYFTFSGRARRSEYWWFQGFAAVNGLIGIIPIIGQLASFVISLAIIIPTISLTSRRLHDIGKTGWWQLPFFILVAITSTAAWTPVFLWGFAPESLPSWGLGVALISMVTMIAILALWIIWMVRKGDLGPNRYGPDPRQAGRQETEDAPTDPS